MNKQSSFQDKPEPEINIDFSAFDKPDPKAKPSKQVESIIAEKIKLVQAQEKNDD